MMINRHTNKETATAFRTVADYYESIVRPLAASAARAKAKELDPPLPKAYGWHDNVRCSSFSYTDDLYPYKAGGLLTREGWIFVTYTGMQTPPQNGNVVVVPSEKKSTPRVLRLGDPCPESGTRWRSKHSAVRDVVVMSNGKYRNLDKTESMYAKSWLLGLSFPWDHMPIGVFPLTEVLDGEPETV